LIVQLQQLEVMNLPLLDAFESEVPEQLEPFGLRSKNAAICRWNLQGTHLAVGADDGRLVVWDMQTRRIVRNLLGHAAVITCLSWSSDGALLMSAGEDWNVILWNVLTGKRQWARQYSSPITMACLCPGNNTFGAISSLGSVPGWLSWEDGMVEEPMAIELHPGEDDKGVEVFVGNFDSTGKTLAIGSSSSHLHLYNVEDRRLIQAVKLWSSGGGGVRSLSYDAKIGSLFVNCADRALRHCPIEPDGTVDVDEITKFKDLVESPQWTAWAVSPSGEHVVTVPDSKGIQLLFVWEVSTGQLVRKLEGPRDGGGILDVAVSLLPSRLANSSSGIHLDQSLLHCQSGTCCSYGARRTRRIGPRLHPVSKRLKKTGNIKRWRMSLTWFLSIFTI